MILQRNHIHYPTIFALVMDILLIQGSSVPCEWVFSSAKKTLTDHQSCVQPELMEGLQMLKYSVKQGHSINFTAGSSWEDDEVAIEKLIVIDADAPESLRAYQDFLVHCKVKPTNNDEDSWSLLYFVPVLLYPVYTQSTSISSMCIHLSLLSFSSRRFWSTAIISWVYDIL